MLDQAEIEITLKAAFTQCEQALCPLTEQQKQVILQAVLDSLSSVDGNHNPLDELTLAQRQALLEFITDQEKLNLSWKIRLLNDWLNEQDSGSVQFIREQFGFEWLNRVKPIHWQEYLQQVRITRDKLQVGDLIEISNGLWEWVQDDGQREWFPCRVIELSEVSDDEVNYASCIVRFENGLEYEIQGIYQWNRGNWRFSKSE